MIKNISFFVLFTAFTSFNTYAEVPVTGHPPPTSNASTDSQQDQLATEVSVKSQFTQLWRNHHPAILFKCWGRPEEVEVYQRELYAQSTNNQGSSSESYIATAKDYDFGARPFKAFTPQAVKWDSRLSKDRVLTLSFSQEVIPSDSYSKDHACNTQSMFTKLDAIANSYKSNASFYVPKDVYMVRVREIKKEVNSKTLHELNAVIDNAKKIVPDRKGGLNSVESGSKFSVGEYDYFFVTPGERIDFSVSWISQSIENASFEVSYEIKLLGQDLCMNDYLIDSNGSFFDVSNLMQSTFSSEAFKNNPHDVIAGLSCLRSQKILAELLRGYHASDLVFLLSQIQNDFQQFESERRTLEDYYQISWVVTQMALLDISRTILSDLYVFCDTKTVYGLFPGEARKIIKVRGYHYAARQYYKMKWILERIPVLFLQTFVETLETLAEKNKSYKELASKETLKLLENLELSIFSAPFRTPFLLEDKLKDLPETDINSAGRKTLMAELQQTKIDFDKLDSQFRKQLISFGHRLPKKVEAKVLKSAFEKYMVSIARVEKSLLTDMNWLDLEEFMSGLEMPFTRDMHKLNTELMAVSGQLLENFYRSNLGAGTSSDFIRYDEMNRMYKSVNSCLSGLDQ
jgi:hypothetical protein